MDSGTGTCQLTLNQSGNDNYSAAPQVSGGVTTALKATATITLNTQDLAAIYDGATHAVGYTTTAASLAPVSVTYSGIAPSVYPASIVPPTKAGSYAVITRLDDQNYQAVEATGTLVIARRALTVTGLSALNKGYDGTTSATITGTATLVGVIAGDSVSLAGTPVGTFSDATIGTGKLVTITGLSISGYRRGKLHLDSTDSYGGHHLSALVCSIIVMFRQATPPDHLRELGWQRR